MFFTTIEFVLSINFNKFNFSISSKLFHIFSKKSLKNLYCSHKYLLPSSVILILYFLLSFLSLLISMKPLLDNSLIATVILGRERSSILAISFAEIYSFSLKIFNILKSNLFNFNFLYKIPI